MNNKNIMYHESRYKNYNIVLWKSLYDKNDNTIYEELNGTKKIRFYI